MTSATPEERADGLMTLFLDDRLKDANEPPGLREAIVERLVGQVDDIGKRFGEQIDHLRSSWAKRMPDAYLADEEVVENELQAIAAGIRTARALAGVLSDPRRFEQTLAQRLAPNARWALRGEASRVPRPPTRASVLNWSLTPIPWVEDNAEWPPAGAIALAGIRQLAGADGEPIRVSEEPYKGWVQLALFERQATLATRSPDIAARQILIATGIEACGGRPPVDSMPLSRATPYRWAVGYKHLAPNLDAERARIALSSTRGPLAALIDYEGQPGAPAHDRGVGLQRFTLVPRIEVIALLGLRPETPALRHVLVDDNGTAIVGRQWRGFLIHDGSYSPLEPAIHGADLILRPDLYETLVDTVGKDRHSLGVSVSHSENAPSPGPPKGSD
ncbi:hypothetical protein [Micromonospora yangpuensis]|uniref:Uncharacterized protein n=1 Tax=Micromonospora yangpuensis TaxID=683228 RepID=A0A1C6U938_9ACTN|nr:hypothetical protein [Micromonospora yangpuensis]GGL88616.1 hypothetical protein GCM10012279_02800 [Micromonospora yangpuensis]SCL50615.1 hypothetical protein GA0070617_1537 [Micromonospora yangpuensis]